MRNRTVPRSSSHPASAADRPPTRAALDDGISGLETTPLTLVELDEELGDQTFAYLDLGPDTVPMKRPTTGKTARMEDAGALDPPTDIVDRHDVHQTGTKSKRTDLGRDAAHDDQRDGDDQRAGDTVDRADLAVDGAEVHGPQAHGPQVREAEVREAEFHEAEFEDGLAEIDGLEVLGPATGSIPVPVGSASTRGVPSTAAVGGIEASAPAGPGRRHIPALDGLRAIAVGAVLCYHAGVSWLPGGLLGVDTFFVLSGFLITSLLLTEWDRDGRINLAKFWGRRARRLMPALVLVLLGMAAYARFIAPGQAASLRSDGLATLFYVANWRFAFSHQGYFAHSLPPSPLLHTWSLAVEEQFYVLWPLMVLGLLAVGARRPRRRRRVRPAVRVRALALVGAVGSAATALLLSLHHADSSRIYYGTDTRSQALFVGAALAGALAMRTRPFGRAATFGLSVAGCAALGGVLAVFATVDGQSSGLDRGGFLLVALAVAVVLTSVTVATDGPLAKVLSVAPLRYLGRISYGLYLYHWPLFLVLTAGRTHLTGLALLGLRFGVTLVVSVVSFHLFEQPVRTGALRLPAPRVAVPAALAAVVATVVITTATVPSAAAGDGGVNASTLDKVAAQSAAKPNQIVPKTAGPNRPVRLMIVGDSVAWTFAWNIGTAHIDLSSYGVALANRAIIGCGIMGDITQHVKGKLDYGNAVCPHWQELWAQDTAQVQPDVVGILVGRWETTDRLINGRWTHVGEPDFDAFLAGQLDKGIETVSARGAKVALLTAPTYQLLEGPNGAPYTETLGSRVDAFNRDLRAAAARHPGVAQIVDFGRVLSPDDQYHLKIDGQVVRWADDGVHVTPDGSRLEVKAIMPALVKIGRAAIAEHAEH